MANEEMKVAILEIAEKERLELKELVARVDIGTPEEREACVAELLKGGLLTEDDLDIVRTPPNVLWSRLCAMGCATSGKSGAARRAFWADGATDGDLAALTEVGHLVGTVGASPSPDDIFKIPGGHEEGYYNVGCYLGCLLSLGGAPDDPVALATIRLGDWSTAIEIQTRVNEGKDPNAEGSGWMAIQQVEERLRAFFDAGTVDMRSVDPERVWRESTTQRNARIARLSLALLGRSSVSVERLAKAVRYPVDIVTEELRDLADAGIVEFDGTDTEAVLDLGTEGIPTILALGASTVTTNAIAEEIKEKAALQERLEAKTADFDDIAGWVEARGYKVEDVLDEVRGIVRKARGERKEFDFIQARTVNETERGEIAREVFLIEDKIGAVHTKKAEAVERFKSEIKGFEADIKDLKNAFQSNQRTVSIRAYRVTDWDAGVEHTLAVDDDRVLETKPIPANTQRPLIDDGAPPAEEKPVTREAITDLADKLRERGFKVTESKGEVPVVHAPSPGPSPEEEDNLDDSPALEAADEPGPLATEEQRTRARAKRGSRKPKTEAAATT